MSTIKHDKNKKPKGPLVITKQSPKKVKLDVLFATINRTYYFRDRNVAHVFWALKNTKCS